MSTILQDRIPADLYARLENWGRAMRVTREQGKSITGIICDDMAKHAGQGALGKESTGMAPVVNHADAAHVEMVWRSNEYHMISRDDHRRLIIKAHFVIGSHPGATCRALKIRPMAYDDTLVAATLDFGDRLAAWGKSFDRTEEMRAMV